MCLQGVRVELVCGGREAATSQDTLGTKTAPPPSPGHDARTRRLSKSRIHCRLVGATSCHRFHRPSARFLLIATSVRAALPSLPIARGASRLKFFLLALREPDPSERQVRFGFGGRVLDFVLGTLS